MMGWEQRTIRRADRDLLLMAHLVAKVRAQGLRQRRVGGHVGAAGQRDRLHSPVVDGGPHAAACEHYVASLHARAQLPACACSSQSCSKDVPQSCCSASVAHMDAIMLVALLSQ